MDKIIKPKISIAIPVYKGMPNADFFLSRCLDSIKEQTYTNYEIVMLEKGSMSETTNEVIKNSHGELIKILYQDDFFAHENALKDIVERFDKKTNWMVTGCINDKGQGEHYASYNDRIHFGNNTIGSPSVLTIRNDNPLMFDENSNWLLDCDYYKRLFERYGQPTIFNSVNVVIGVGEHQATNIFTDDYKNKEHEYMLKKYDTTK